MERLTILTRELTPFEHLVAKLLCDGLSNAAIARETAHTEKVVENTVSRMAKALGVSSGASRTGVCWWWQITGWSAPITAVDCWQACRR